MFPGDVFRGSCASRKEKIGRNAFVQEELTFCIWELFSPEF
jgi:hypothetical protein